MNHRVAVIDLGTNTFHLLIAEGTAENFTEIVHEHESVKLGEGGINSGLIQPAAFERGMLALRSFHQLILKHSAQQVRALATSALRNAANGQEFIDEVKAKTGIIIEIIDGNAEAGYIYKGIKAAGCLSAQNSLIVDIGGGSVEFIICDNQRVKWQHSYEIGAARLMDKFHRVDPIPPASIVALELYLEKTLKDLFIAAPNYSIVNMIGSSGVFETYATLIEQDKGNPFDLNVTKNYAFNSEDLLAVIKKLMLSSHLERKQTKGILPVRVDMAVTASILTRLVMQKLGIGEVLMSTSSLKEGVLVEMLR